MNIRNMLLFFLVIMVMTPWFSLNAADRYRIDWYTIDNGGGMSSNGRYVLTGTIGQADTDWSSVGINEIFGGFWPGGIFCIVHFSDFAKLADLWLYNGSGLAGDLDEDSDIDFDDLRRFSEYWLLPCPSNWPLK